MPYSLLRVASCFVCRVLYSSRSALSFLRVPADTLARFVDLPTHLILARLCVDATGATGPAASRTA